MRIVKQHRRTAIAVGALSTALAVGLASLVVAQVPNSPNTIKSRVQDAVFTGGTQTVIPTQTLDPGSICPAGATATDPTCELWAKPGSITIAGVAGPVPVWGYATSATGPAMVPGPIIQVSSGQAVSIKVHNALPTNAGQLGFTARSMNVTQRTLTPSNNTDATATYTFTAGSAGTSVYSASADSPAGNRQIAMGLAGTLIVKPTNCPAASMGCAFGDPLTAGGSGSLLGFNAGTDVYDGEALVATNEIDLNLNQAANPAAFDMTTYHPTVHLINGKAFPDTQVIDGFAGANILLRYANLGLADHSMGLVGAHQRTIGRDGSALPHGSDDVTIPLNVGQTADVMVDIPVGARAGYRYALADQSRQPGTQSADAALTFLTVWGVPNDPSKPMGTVTITNGPTGTDTAGVTALRFNYTIPAFSPAVTGVRWSIDAPGNSPTVLGSVAPGSYIGGITPAALSLLANGGHVLWLEWSNDPSGPLQSWGSPMGAAFTIDRAGPAMAPVDVDPVYSDGTVDVAIASTADATLTGTGEVTEALWSIAQSPAVCAALNGQAMSLNGAGTNGAGPVVEVSATIPAASVPDTDGIYTVFAQAGDNRGMWSNTGDGSTPACGEGTIIIDTKEPTVSAGDVSPNNNDGTMAFPTLDSYLPVVRITAHVSDANGTDPGSGIAAVEGFLEDGLQPLPLTEASNGTGFLFTAVDGNFDSSEEDVYADIPLASVATLSPGDHRIWIHGQDLAGNWGGLQIPDPADVDPSNGIDLIQAPAATTLRTLNTAPVVTDVFVDSVSGVPNGNVTITGTANGAGVMITAYEYAVGADPLPLLGTIPANVHSIATADQSPTLYVPLTGVPLTGTQDNIAVRIQDSTGKWSAAQFGKAVVSGLTVTWSNNAHTRQRLQGSVTAAAGGTVDRIGWSASSATLPTGATTVTFAGFAINYQTNNNTTFGPNGSVVWVRARDTTGVWGPAVAVTLPV